MVCGIPSKYPFAGDVGRAKVVFDSQDNVLCRTADLRIVAASAAMQWQDWRLVYDAAAISIDGEVIIDSQRAAAVNILSVVYQEANDGVSASALRIADFQLGTLRLPHSVSAYMLFICAKSMYY